MDVKYKVAYFERKRGFNKPHGIVTIKLPYYLKRPRNAYRRSKLYGSDIYFNKADIQDIIEKIFVGMDGIIVTDYLDKGGVDKTPHVKN